MQRSKQQALMFLLGAVLVGGVLGFSADRVMSAKKPRARVPARVQMYDDIGITANQRARMDSVLDETNCKTAEIMRSVRPAMDSVRAEGLKTFVSMLTPEQRSAYEAREARMKARMDSLEKERDAKWAKEHPGSERPRRCGPGRTGSAAPAAGARSAPGVPAPEHRPGGSLFY
ncbi:MAG TPA: hypothetical protein VFO55_07280 [Gemmatimonadaceae bacterium]|nr:hypothetical protein [Gemmatimonadaceae bacterium]